VARSGQARDASCSERAPSSGSSRLGRPDAATKLGDLSHGTYSNVEQENLAYVKWTDRLGQPVGPVDRVGRDRPGGLLAEHNLRGPPGDSKSRASSTRRSVPPAGITSNQIADRENLPRSDAPVADELWFPLANAPASAYDEHGMTWAQKLNAVGILVRSGYDPTDALVQLGLPEIKHTGAVPVTLQVDPSTLTP